MHAVCRYIRITEIELISEPKYLAKVKKYKNNANIIYTLEDGLMEFVGDYVSDRENKHNIEYIPNWYNDYTRENIPNWNVYYFHFKSLNKCVIFVQFNHIIADGILISKLTQQMYIKMKNPSLYQNMVAKAEKEFNALANVAHKVNVPKS